MSTGAPTAAVSRRAWRTALITATGEVLATGRMAAAAVRLAVQVVLLVVLWRALYEGTASSAGLVREQAVTFAVLAALVGRIRGTDRGVARDTVLQHVNGGTIVYWFLRPLPPRRYYFYRSLGDQLYGLGWAAVAFAVCRLAGVVTPPASPAAAVASAASVVLGLVVFHYLLLLIDLMCFWTIRNQAAVLILAFAQNLLSGAYAPLWYFPDWFRAVSAFLPFEATLNTPLSLYVGRIPVHFAGSALAVQAAWALLLAVVSRWLWARAARRVASQGG